MLVDGEDQVDATGNSGIAIARTKSVACVVNSIYG